MYIFICIFVPSWHVQLLGRTIKRSNRKKKVEDAGERGIDKRRKVFQKTREKRIDLNSREGGNRPVESRRNIKQILRNQCILILYFTQ